MSNLNLDTIRINLNNVVDIKYREIKCGEELITIVFSDVMSDSNLISNFIIKPLLDFNKKIDSVEVVLQEVIRIDQTQRVCKLDMALSQILKGYALLFFSSYDDVISCEVKGFSKRSIEEASTETVIKGPREGFTENHKDNISSIRRRLSTPDLKIIKFTLGKKSQTAVDMLYMEEIAPKELVKYITDKLNSLNDRDYVLYSNTLEEEIKCKGTPFDTIGYTEKPDIAAQNISEGRVVVIFNGTPFAVIAPYFFIENFHATDDYTLNKFTGNIGRTLRVVAFILATLFPGLYLALVTHHYKLIPTVLLFRLSVSRAGVPVPTVLELIIMIVFFQILREAGVRLPQPIGSTLSIVGALILGDAAVASGLTSHVTVVVVGITSICSYLVPKVYIGIFTWNTIIILFSAFLGLPGFFTGFVVLVAHLANLTSCGYPYLYPLGTRETFKYKDVVFRGNLSEISNNVLLRDGK